MKTLDVKIQAEIQMLKGRLAKMRADIAHYEDLDGLRGRSAAATSVLQQVDATYLKRKARSQVMLRQAQSMWEQQRADLSAMDSAKELSTHEETLRQSAGRAYELQECAQPALAPYRRPPPSPARSCR